MLRITLKVKSAFGKSIIYTSTLLHVINNKIKMAKLTQYSKVDGDSKKHQQKSRFKIIDF